METVLALLTGTMVAGSVFLMLGKNLVRFIFGLVLASNAVNLLIFAAGRPDTARPPLIPDGGDSRQQSAPGPDPDRHRHRICLAGIHFYPVFTRLPAAGNR